MLLRPLVAPNSLIRRHIPGPIGILCVACAAAVGGQRLVCREIAVIYLRDLHSVSLGIGIVQNISYFSLSSGEVRSGRINGLAGVHLEGARFIQGVHVLVVLGYGIVDIVVLYGGEIRPG